jgi:hypothetical protein
LHACIPHNPRSAWPFSYLFPLRKLCSCSFSFINGVLFPIFLYSNGYSILGSCQNKRLRKERKQCFISAMQHIGPFLSALWDNWIINSTNPYGFDLICIVIY